MKAILVIDMPEICSNCPCYNDDLGFCQASDEDDYLWGGNARPSWCPLKPLPEKREVENAGTNYGEEPWFSDGWNACIEEIDR